MTIFTLHQVERFKREATALKKSSGMLHSKALDAIATRENFNNWSTLMKAVNYQFPQLTGNIRTSFNYKTLLEVCKCFIQNLDETEVFTLCRNGSLWIDKDHASNGYVTVDSLHAMGSSSNGAIRQYGLSIGVLLLTDFEGLADAFILDTDEDDYGNPLVPSHGQVIYTPATGAQKLLNCIGYCLEGDFDSLNSRLYYLTHEN